MGDDGEHDVQLEIAESAAEGDGGVVADDLRRLDLDERISDMTGLTLPGMMEEPGWVAGQFELADAAAGAGTEEADVVGDLDEADGDGLERAAGFDGGVAGGLGFEMVFGFAEFEAGIAGDGFDGFAGEVDVGVDAGADGGAAEGEFAEVGFEFLEAFDAVLDLAGVAAEFLAEADGGGVLQVGAADFFKMESPRPGPWRGGRRGVRSARG